MRIEGLLVGPDGFVVTPTIASTETVVGGFPSQVLGIRRRFQQGFTTNTVASVGIERGGVSGSGQPGFAGVNGHPGDCVIDQGTCD